MLLFPTSQTPHCTISRHNTPSKQASKQAKNKKSKPHPKKNRPPPSSDSRAQGADPAAVGPRLLLLLGRQRSRRRRFQRQGGLFAHPNTGVKACPRIAKGSRQWRPALRSFVRCFCFVPFHTGKGTDRRRVITPRRGDARSSRCHKRLGRGIFLQAGTGVSTITRGG